MDYVGALRTRGWRHHAFADKAGDPHSPWLFGTTPAAVAKGFWHNLHHADPTCAPTACSAARSTSPPS
ncbi:MAG: hypothetical protein ACRDTA_18385 [Pseudonocardiaceae bacterium]